MVGLVGKPNFELVKFAIFRHVLIILIFFFFWFWKKVRSLSSLPGRPSALSARLKLQSEVTWWNLANFDNLKETCTTKSTILNKMALFKMQK